MKNKVLVFLIFVILIGIFVILIKMNFQNTSNKTVKSLIESPTDGYVVYNVSYESTVYKGQLVAEIDPTVYINQVKQDLVDVSFEKKEYKRYKFLSHVNAAAREIFDTTEKDYGDAITKLHSDQAALRHCYQYAPFTGKVTNIVTSAGSGVSDGGSILEITKIG
ncbi:MAG: hypothetical protein GY756_24655 [bacterium]|nr:hypothetical protein [bacterium]